MISNLFIIIVFEGLIEQFDSRAAKCLNLRSVDSQPEIDSAERKFAHVCRTETKKSKMYVQRLKSYFTTVLIIMYPTFRSLPQNNIYIYILQYIWYTIFGISVLLSRSDKLKLLKIIPHNIKQAVMNFVHFLKLLFRCIIT